MNWDLLQIPGVLDVIQQAAEKVASHYGLAADDLVQEGSILVATKPDLAACLPEDDPNLGLLQYRLEKDLANLAIREKRQDDRSSSLDERNENWTGAGTVTPNQEWAAANVVVPQPPFTSTYTKELVESLLPAVWDDSYCYGVRAENAPDPDMPRGSTNKATGNTAGAQFADITRAWAKCNLTPTERQALFCRYHLDLTQEESAKLLFSSRRTVGNWLNRGLERLLEFLNGETP